MKPETNFRSSPYIPVRDHDLQPMHQHGNSCSEEDQSSNKCRIDGQSELEGCLELIKCNLPALRDRFSFPHVKEPTLELETCSRPGSCCCTDQRENTKNALPTLLSRYLSE